MSVVILEVKAIDNAHSLAIANEKAQAFREHLEND
jgi:hypothetical protein